tara:strand:+ start:62 stop:862 length:801 start_codon:yes stop_codon:yes gene_type:complete
MKKLITIISTILIALNLNAQKTEQGIWQIEIGSGIEGGFNWVTDGSFDNKITSNGSVISESNGDWSDLYNAQTNLNYGLDFTNFDNWEDRFLKNISFGYFVADGFLIGLSLDLGGFNTNDDDTNSVVKNDNLSLGATPKIRYYIETGRGNSIFLESSFGANLSNTRNKTEISGSEDFNEIKTNSFGSTIGIGVGMAIFNFNSREIFSIEPMIGFNLSSGTTNTTSTNYSSLTDITIVDEQTDTFSSMGAYFKIKLGFYLGRHFWSH